ncbi:siroheme decarboxylase subunit beta [Halalkalicoccus jeotgali]|uniref:siroheme decarboxylase n=1 Tax=Halalkalicoccus jeotgali (strain DSM 18796 / CECT 7217 / JCM 14584 / KCTC 4019 / B3) TaxID=795797 RepID=D8J7Z7_HALJB|nr:Lrp/AsnC family transcriptional regulator [Halalkalicoccus jeotgali]ADJ14110.1 putative transcriptional regulator, AsnC family protein [Halalkalicoccus jeotgali B3]ELY34708.1 putative AsnC family transcriptional regulator [Halalkalicoccus jeotgali B3]
MSTLEDDWRSDLDEVDAALIDGYQSGVPVEVRPFRAIGEAVGVSETEALARVEALVERGIVRRFGAVLNPPVIGSSTLAAVRAPEERTEEVTAVINSYRQVNHNYRRDHEWNTWFVVTAGSRETRDRILAEIEERTGCTVLNLPMLTDFYIDLEFPVVNADRFARESSSGTDRVEATAISEEATGDLTALDAAVLLEIQEGLPLSRTPYADVARATGYDTDAVIESVTRLLAAGCIKRVGCVINHVVTGFTANCMVVWNVPDEELDGRGRAVGALPSVTLCYHRPRRSELGWEYNLFTMIHGRDPAAVDARIDALAEEYLPYEHERLYSTETLKQTGARYDELLSA